MKATREEFINYLNKKVDELKQEVIEEVFKANPNYYRINNIKRIISAYADFIRECEEEMEAAEEEDYTPSAEDYAEWCGKGWLYE